MQIITIEVVLLYGILVAISLGMAMIWYIEGKFSSYSSMTPSFVMSGVMLGIGYYIVTALPKHPLDTITALAWVLISCWIAGLARMYGLAKKAN